MAHKIIGIQRITPPDQRYTVSVNIFNGGCIPNAIPAHAEVIVDSRFSNMADYELIQNEICRVCSERGVPGASISVEVGAPLHAYETTEDVLRVYAFLCDAARKYGLKIPGKVVLGGASDATYIASSGVPTLCACGVCGSLSHTREEYALVESIFSKSLMLTAAILEAKHFRKLEG